MDLSKLPKDAMIGASAYNNDLHHWKGYIEGPEGTPYHTGKFVIDIKFPTDYPFTPPKMQFDTKIWHPNISSVTGAICLDTLKGEWSPALTIRTALLSILAMLSDANPQDPQDGVVAKQYMDDRAAFNAQARAWTLKYAQEGQEPPFEHETQLKTLVDMGFERASARRALEVTAGDLNKALTQLTK